MDEAYYEEGHIAISWSLGEVFECVYLEYGSIVSDINAVEQETKGTDQASNFVNDYFPCVRFLFQFIVLVITVANISLEYH